MEMKKLNPLIEKNRPRLKWAAFILLIGFVFLVNTFHESYPDEFDNLLGGRYVLEGKIIYRDFFTHHGPVAYWLAALIEIPSRISFVRFRVFYSFFLTGFVFASYAFLRRRFRAKADFYPVYITVLAISATYFWGHMLLADSLAGFLLVPVYALVFLSAFHRRPLALRELVFVSFLSASALLSSLSYAYLVAFLYLYSLWLYLTANKHADLKRAVLKGIGVIALPYLLFAAYLVISRSLGDYVRQNFVFNAKYYVYNYPRPEGSGRINPIRFAVMIGHKFYRDFYGALVNAKDLNLRFPFAAGLAVGNAALLAVLLLSRRWLLTVFVWMILTYANTRSNALTGGNTDYQAAVYISLSFLNFSFILPHLYRSLDDKLETARRLIYGSMLLFAGVYGLFTFLFLLREFNLKIYNKFMGLQPLIYDRPQVAPITNQLVKDDDYVWIGPFAFEELFYARGKMPSKYHILLPAMAKSDRIVSAIKADFRKNKPKVIVFDKRYFILGSSPEMYAPFFLKFLSDDYVTLRDYRRQGKSYLSNVPKTNRVDLETELYIDKNRADEVIALMEKRNLIRPLP
jgi:hypothetical protein